MDLAIPIQNVLIYSNHLDFSECYFKFLNADQKNSVESHHKQTVHYLLLILCDRIFNILMQIQTSSSSSSHSGAIL